MIDIKQVEQVGNNLIVTVAMPDVREDDYTIYLHVDALGSRMAMYGVESPHEALGTIVLEHYRRLGELPNPTSKEEAVELMGEDMATLTVNVTSEEVEGIIADNIEQITDAYITRMPQEEQDEQNNADR